MQTYGERAVGLSFNPSGDVNVDKIKRLYAEAIDLCASLRNKAMTKEKRDIFSIAEAQALTAQMWAVKAITWPEDQLSN